VAKKFTKKLSRACLWVVVFWLLQLVFFRFVPVVITPHLVSIRLSGEAVSREWVPLEEVAPDMARAVIASEDNRFCEHWGIDWLAMKIVWKEYRERRRIRGGSTISMQTTKNAYLWLSRSPVRKALEIVMVPWIDGIWGKRRVMEVYLNLVEFGPGIYGVEAAAQHHFRKSASELSAEQAARLAAVMPAPKDWSASRPSRFIRRRARDIELRMDRQGTRADCVLEVD